MQNIYLQSLLIFLGWAIPTACASIAAYFIGKYKNKQKKDAKDEEKQKLLCEGMQCLLRAEIIRQSEKWEKREYCPIYAKEALEREYRVYEGLDGNDVGSAAYHKTIELPDSPPEQHGYTKT